MRDDKPENFTFHSNVKSRAGTLKIQSVFTFQVMHASDRLANKECLSTPAAKY